jgi:transposase-like protein
MWYPKNVLELEDKLHTEEECLDYLFAVRWPQGFVCPRCRESGYWKKSRGRFECQSCHHETSVLVGTIFEGSNLELRVWFRALWWLISEKQGTSAAALQKTLGLGSYRTAWLMLHKLRVAMVNTNRTKLSGDVEFDEFYLGGKTTGGSANRANPENKQLIAVAVEVVGKGSGRVRLLHLPRLNTDEVSKAICDLVEVGSTIITDGFSGYRHIEQKGYRHKSYNQIQAKDKDPNHKSRLPRAHRVISILKRWYYGTYQGRMSKKHSKSYLEEFVFRFNRRTSTARGLLFLRVLENAVLLQPQTYKHLVKSK